jgi:hypothetical protein
MGVVDAEIEIHLVALGESVMIEFCVKIDVLVFYLYYRKETALLLDNNFAKQESSACCMKWSERLTA